MVLLLLFSYTGFTDAVIEKAESGKLVKFDIHELESINLEEGTELINKKFYPDYIEFINKKEDLSFEKQNYSNKNWGIYIGEFLISEIPPTITTIYINMEMIFSERDFEEYRTTYLIVNSTITPIFTYLSGEIFNESGSLWKSIVGATLGSLIGLSITQYTIDNIDTKIVLADIYLSVFPALCATIGYNL